MSRLHQTEGIDPLLPVFPRVIAHRTRRIGETLRSKRQRDATLGEVGRILSLDDAPMAKAQASTGLGETSMVREALNAFVERESARRLARLGGGEPGAEPSPRRRPASV